MGREKVVITRKITTKKKANGKSYQHYSKVATKVK
jgi:hypothetical protein